MLEEVKSILEKYLEQSHLLDPHLDAIVDIVMGRVRELVMEREAEVFGHTSSAAGRNEAGSGVGKAEPGKAFPFQVLYIVCLCVCRGISRCRQYACLNAL